MIGCISNRFYNLSAKTKCRSFLAGNMVWIIPSAIRGMRETKGRNIYSETTRFCKWITCQDLSFCFFRWPTLEKDKTLHFIVLRTELKHAEFLFFLSKLRHFISSGSSFESFELFTINMFTHSTSGMNSGILVPLTKTVRIVRFCSFKNFCKCFLEKITLYCFSITNIISSSENFEQSDAPFFHASELVKNMIGRQLRVCDSSYVLSATKQFFNPHFLANIIPYLGTFKICAHFKHRHLNRFRNPHFVFTIETIQNKCIE